MSNSTEIQVSSQPVFNFGEHKVRVVVRDGEPWFVAADVCAALSYSNTSKALGDHLDADERNSALVPTPNAPLGVPTNVISESGLYALVLRSRKPEARKFAKWVTSEVLPAIRKTGIYVGKSFSVNPAGELTQDEQDTLRTLLQSAAEQLPKSQRGKFMMQGWAKLKSHFKVTYREIPRSEFSAAVSIVTRHTVEWEVVEEEAQYKPLEPGKLIVDRSKLAAIWVDLGKLRQRLDGLGVMASDLPPAWWQEHAISQ